MAALALLPVVPACRSAPPPAAAATTAPTAASATARHAIVVAANPLAAQAGMRVLQAGGSAADAAVAMQAVLGLVEPQSSSLAGGAFITYYDARKKRVLAYDGRETAPAGARADMFLGSDGRPLPFATAVLSGRSTGVPGAIAALGLLQHEHGKLAWHALFDDAERLATDGFKVSPRLAGMISSGAPQTAAPDVVRYFTKGDGSRYKSGDLLMNPAYAATLRGCWPIRGRARFIGAGWRRTLPIACIRATCPARCHWPTSRATARLNRPRCAATGSSIVSVRHRRRPVVSACSRACCCSHTPTSARADPMMRWPGSSWVKRSA